MPSRRPCSGPCCPTRCRRCGAWTRGPVPAGDPRSAVGGDWYDVFPLRRRDGPRNRRRVRPQHRHRRDHGPDPQRAPGLRGRDPAPGRACSGSTGCGPPAPRRPRQRRLPVPSTRPPATAKSSPGTLRRSSPPAPALPKYLDDAVGHHAGRQARPSASPLATVGFRRALRLLLLHRRAHRRPTPRYRRRTRGARRNDERLPQRMAEQTCATVQSALACTARQDDICLLTARLTWPVTQLTQR